MLCSHHDEQRERLITGQELAWSIKTRTSTTLLSIALLCDLYPSQLLQKTSY